MTTIDAQRRGVFSSDDWTTVDDTVIGVEGDVVDLIFQHSRGYGISRYPVRIRPDNFATLAEAMMHADTETAMRAFGAALQKGTPEHPWHERETTPVVMPAPT